MVLWVEGGPEFFGEVFEYIWSRTQLWQPPPLLHIFLAIPWHALKGIECRRRRIETPLLDPCIAANLGVKGPFMYAGTERKEGGDLGFLGIAQWSWESRSVAWEEWCGGRSVEIDICIKGHDLPSNLVAAFYAARYFSPGFRFRLSGWRTGHDIEYAETCSVSLCVRLLLALI